jgi:flagellar motor switch/type III secretory pathway protein FliN
LGELALTLQQIEHLQPGQTLELPQDVSESRVRLRVHGQTIAEGRLIVIGRKLGVRLERVGTVEAAVPVAPA